MLTEDDALTQEERRAQRRDSRRMSDDLDPHRPRSFLPATAQKQVILIRHGQSKANAAGSAAEVDHQSPQWLDAPMTALGRSQASSWSGVAPTWDVDEVWCSPLSRAMETACRVFANVDVPIRITPYAREGWWHCSENRGRLAHAIEAGTDGTSDEVRWPKLSSLPGSHKLRGLERVAKPLPKLYDPEEESRLHAQEKELFALWEDAIEELKRELAASKARRIALVCHWGIIEQLTKEDVENCTVIPTIARVIEGAHCADGQQSCYVRVCHPVLTHPPLGV
jgi:broad specificity phosphatase PhoE